MAVAAEHCYCLIIRQLLCPHIGRGKQENPTGPKDCVGGSAGRGEERGGEEE